MNKNNLLLYLLILGTFVLSMRSSIAKDFKFQVPFSRDCKLYEQFYEGVSCRNASFDDIPTCEDSEEIVSSPRKGKLCCCTRELGEIGENIIGGEQDFCQIIGCENASNPTRSKDPSALVCSRSELSVVGIKITNPTNPMYSNITNYCCCPGGIANVEAITCSNYINCRELTGPECTPSFPSFDEINVDQGVDESIERTFSCCCLPAKTE